MEELEVSTLETLASQPDPNDIFEQVLGLERQDIARDQVWDLLWNLFAQH